MRRLSNLAVDGRSTCCRRGSRRAATVCSSSGPLGSLGSAKAAKRSSDALWIGRLGGRRAQLRLWVTRSGFAALAAAASGSVVAQGSKTLNLKARRVPKH